MFYRRAGYDAAGYQSDSGLLKFTWASTAVGNSTTVTLRGASNDQISANISLTGSSGGTNGLMKSGTGTWTHSSATASVPLLAVPEPSVAVSLLGGFEFLLGFQRSRRKNVGNFHSKHSWVDRGGEPRKC